MRSVERGVCESLVVLLLDLLIATDVAATWEAERMMYHSQRVGANGDATTDPAEAAAAQLSRPTTTDRTAAMAAELHALPALLTVGETAEVLRVGRSWVYEHAAEIGAVKLGPGQTAPLRIPREGVWRIVGVRLHRGETGDRFPSRRARKAETSNGDLRARPRM